ncbi:MAG TPA: cation:proton antiporter [Stellaceae bacterium]|nr:cation:proton antiporter [Stellaceae bacterium]
MHTIASTTLVIAAFLVVISAVQPFAARLHVPFTVLLACVGVLVGGLSSFLVRHLRLEPVLDIAEPLANLPISAPVFLIVFLPLLLFHAALMIDLREIARDVWPILTLAILAVFAAAAAIGFGLSFAGVPLLVGLLLGAIVATTDPAAVIAIFREVGAPPRLTRLVEGESLLNDAAAIVLFGILVAMLAGGVQSSISHAVLEFATTFVGGIVLGAVAGRLFGAALPWLGSSRTAEVTLSVALPYIVYLVSEHFHVSGVVAVASAGLTAGAIARVRVRPGNWRHIERVWAQLDFWASSLIFIMAAAVVPRLVGAVEPWHAGLLLIAVAAALLSRAAVLFGILPLLSALRLSQKVDGAYKLAITWGGLRGAITLALALALTEHPNIDPAIKELVAVLATGFVLFTLLVNGLTLRPVIRLLQLDRLSPLNEALRGKVLALSLVEVRDAVRQSAQNYRIDPTAARSVAEDYNRRIDELDSRPDLDQAISDEDRIRIGLVALTNRERRIILDHHEQRTVSGAAVEQLLHNTNRILDAARSEGREGYDRVACQLLAFPRRFRVAHFLHRTLHIAGPLQREISIRFEVLLTRRLALEELARFAGTRLEPMLGRSIATALRGIIAGRAEEIVRALDALRLQYPEHARTLEARFLEQSGLQLLILRYQDLFEEGLIGGELFDDLQQEHARQLLSDRLPPLDLGLQTEQLIRSFPMFAGLDETELKAVIRVLRPRLLVPDEVIIRKGERGRSMFFIASGAVEVVLPGQRVRLGSGDFFGEMALLNRGPRTADVVSLGYGRVLELARADFRRFLRNYPRARAEIESTAAARTRDSARLTAS